MTYLPIVYFLFPETAGFSLEMVDLCFMDQEKSPVAKSKELHQAMKRGEIIHITDEFGDEKIGQAIHVEVN